MKNKATYALLFTVVFSLMAGQTAAQLPGKRQLSVSTNRPVPSAPIPLKHIAAIRSINIPGGARVIITSDASLSDYTAGREGDRFYVVIPKSAAPPGQLNLSGRGFTEARAEARGNDMLLSFRLEEGVGASVNQKFNQLDIIFTKSGDSSAYGTSEALNDARTRPRSVRSATNLSSAPQPQASTDKPDNKLDVDLTVPESPAFTVLGVTPETVTRPTTPKAFATSLLNGVDQSGNFQTGIALDFVPYLTFAGTGTSLFNYRRSRMERFLARTQLSFATAKGVTDDDESTRLALGLRVTLWDTGDPRLDSDLENCYARADRNPLLSTEAYLVTPEEQDDPDKKGAKLRVRKQLLTQLYAECNVEARKKNWNASGWIIGMAPSWISKTGETKNFVWNGGGFWTSASYGFESVESLKDNSQLIFHFRYRNNEIVADADNPGDFFSQDSLFFGTRLRLAPGKEANSIFSLEGVFVRSRRESDSFDNSSRYSLGLERRLGENIWLAFSLGGQSGRTDGNNQAFVLTSFKWGINKKDESK